jgi:hypothetical protein
LEPSFELDEFDVSIIVYNINPHPEVENMTVRTAKETNIILIARRKFGRRCGGRVTVDSFFLEGNPDFSFGILHYPICSFSILLIHSFESPL